jgi:endonuclease/exonuclease/phosphatase family metal-dependent hydrolase
MREFGIASIVLLLTLTSVSNPTMRTGESAQDSVTVDTVDHRPVQETLRVLTYNAFLRPPPIGWGDKTACRAEQISRRLANEPIPRDIIALNETFDRDRLDTLAANLQERFPYQLLGQPESRGFRTNGGLSLLSRHPIEHSAAHTFERCSGDFNDCLATKGFLWALVRVSHNLKVNVIVTHMNSGGDDSARKARASQLAQIQRFMDSQPMLDRWPTVLMGDLNVNGLRWRPRHPESGDLTEYATAMAQLGNTCAQCETAACFAACRPFPVDAFRRHTGKWSFDAAGTRQASTYNCSGQNMAPCTDLNVGEQWRERMRLDYVLHFGPPALVPDMAVEVLNASSLDFKDNVCGTTYLSDHQGVEATLEIRREPDLNAAFVPPSRAHNPGQQIEISR